MAVVGKIGTKKGCRLTYFQRNSCYEFSDGAMANTQEADWVGWLVRFAAVIEPKVDWRGDVLTRVEHSHLGVMRIDGPVEYLKEPESPEQVDEATR